MADHLTGAKNYFDSRSKEPGYKEAYVNANNPVVEIVYLNDRLQEKVVWFIRDVITGETIVERTPVDEKWNLHTDKDRIMYVYSIYNLYANNRKVLAILGTGLVLRGSTHNLPLSESSKEQIDAYYR